MGRAIIVSEQDGRADARLTDLDEGLLEDLGTVVDVAYSDLNYKDALAVTGRPGVVRRHPLIAGIDLVGRVVESDDPRFGAGDWLVLTGGGLSETRHGGYATRAHVDAALALPLPDGLTPARAAALGTAGYTAALAVDRLAADGVTPDDGPILVTGATGGVGSITLLLLAAAGFEAHALTGRRSDYEDYLRGLGAAAIVDREDLSGEGRPLQKAAWAGVVDAVGGEVLANAIARTRPAGVVAACGLAGSPQLPTTVLPFILRGVTLAGIDSVWAPREARERAWDRLARDVDGAVLDGLTSSVGLDQVIPTAEDLLAGRTHGRIRVDVSGG